MQRRSGGKGERLRVAVLMGGPSSEHEISLQSGQNVVSALSPKVFEIRPAVITREGAWHLPPRGWKPPEPLEAADGAPATPSFDPHALEGWRRYEGACEALVALREWPADVAIPVLHGRFGEDGTVQGALELLGIPYTGSGVLASAIAIDKIMTRRVWVAEGLRTPAWRTLVPGADFAAVFAALGAPCIVKPAREGSTLGLSKVETAAGMDKLVHWQV